MTNTTTRTLADRMGAVSRMIAAMSRDTTEWDVADLPRLDRITGEIAMLRAIAVYGLRDRGFTDGQIGQALGITQQAVSKRWPGGGRYVGAAGRYRKPKEDT